MMHGCAVNHALQNNKVGPLYHSNTTPLYLHLNPPISFHLLSNMSSNIVTMFKPGIAASIMQMVAYYNACHIDATTLHLLHTEEVSWP